MLFLEWILPCPDPLDHGENAPNDREANDHSKDVGLHVHYVKLAKGEPHVHLEATQEIGIFVVIVVLLSDGRLI